MLRNMTREQLIEWWAEDQLRAEEAKEAEMQKNVEGRVQQLQASRIGRRR
jgi:hypothetical protein